MTVDVASLVSDNLDIWTTAIERKSGAGRGGGKRISLYGIERLRALVLELAVRGKLVPQDGNEEPAAALLDRIPDDWAAAKRRHRSRSTTSTEQPTEPAKIPDGWCAVAGNTIFRTRSGNSKLIKGTLHSEDGPNRFPGYSASGQDVWLDDYEHDGVAIILSAVGARCGKAFLTRGKWSAVANTHIIWLLETVTEPDFAMLVLNNENFWDRAGGAQPFVKVGNTLDRDFLLPPLSEQRRIVAKVDELMALCDTLEAESVTAMAAHRALIEALLATLTASTDATDLATNWARLEAHFDTLFSTEASIDALKQTILDLAVRGKLVEKAVGDGSAAQILKDIKVAKAKLIGGMKTRKSAENSLGMPLGQLFELPEGWAWAPLGQLVSLLGDGIHGTPTYDSNGDYYFINGNNLSDGHITIKGETKRVSLDQYEKHKKLLEQNTVLVSINGTIGNVAFFNNENVILGKSACYFNLMPGISKEYVLKIIKSRHFLDYAHSQATGSTIKNVSLKTMRELPIPLPPLAEQSRIVAKVDELTALCEALKAEITSATETQRHLANSIVEQAAA